MVLKAKRATTGVHHRDHDEFRGSRSDIVRQVATTKQQQQADKCGRAEKKNAKRNSNTEEGRVIPVLCSPSLLMPPRKTGSQQTSERLFPPFISTSCGSEKQEYISTDLAWLLRTPAYTAVMPEWMATTCSNALDSMNTRLTTSCQVIYSQFGLAIHPNDHQARHRFVEWAQNEIAVVPDFHKRILFSDEAHFWLNGYVNKQKCRIWSEANPQVYVETPLHPEKLTVGCTLWAGGILLQKR
ncbi:hypothetical protein TNCV_4495992 [Trichonephila clavipes]|nr:hypothetical protein TNCV_4495992 [Trichonephila clavipes]